MTFVLPLVDDEDEQGRILTDMSVGQQLNLSECASDMGVPSLVPDATSTATRTKTSPPPQPRPTSPNNTMPDTSSKSDGDDEPAPTPPGDAGSTTTTPKKPAVDTSGPPVVTGTGAATAGQAALQPSVLATLSVVLAAIGALGLWG